MSTRAEQYRAESQKTGKSKSKRARPTRSRSKRRSRTDDAAHVSKKSTYALEEGTKKRSRKSTRKSANRSKPDTGLIGRAELVRGTPTARYRRSRASSARSAPA